ncbi:Hypothetical predicted protein [Pelobates cultripes]|uniref:Uncharacterized protein n=1 Tax=Pelobates cultripes TaxID=61616 RepID=A0AAD1R3Q9_PELCU|nr:Hypothetical predicted protein [Pelobates cultripes]
MVILPKIQYLFRTLPLRLPKKYLMELQNVINDFVWDNKKPRVSKATMYKPHAQGGMGLPELAGYYRAAHIAPLIAATHSQVPTAWAKLEERQARKIPIQTLAWLPKTHRPKASELLPTTALTLSIWDSYRKKRGATNLLSPAMPLETLRQLIPDFNYKLWQRHGITTISHIMQGNNPKSFSELRTEFKLPNTAAFSYLQLQSWIRIHTPTQPADPPNLHWT